MRRIRHVSRAAAEGVVNLGQDAETNAKEHPIDGRCPYLRRMQGQKSGSASIALRSQSSFKWRSYRVRPRIQKWQRHIQDTKAGARQDSDGSAMGTGPGASLSTEVAV